WCGAAGPWCELRVGCPATLAIHGAPLARASVAGFAPVELALFECRLAVWIGDRRLQRGIGKAREARELFSSALRNRQRQLRAKIAEKKKWRRRREFLAHKQERRGRRKQDAGDRGAQRERVGDLYNEIAIR